MCVLYKILILRGAASINFKPRHNNITLIKYCKSLPGECQTECEKDANVNCEAGLLSIARQVPVDFGGAMGYDSHTVICVTKGEFAKTPNSQERGKS